MLSRVHSVGVRGVEGYPVLVELDMAAGLPCYATVGLPDSAVRESRERVTSAVRNSGFLFPPRKITVNLAPAQSRKEGTQFDLPIALAFLSASGQVPGGRWPQSYCFVGELALDGGLRPVAGVLPMAERAKALGFEVIVVPEGNADEARATGLKTLSASTLRQVVEFVSGQREQVFHESGEAPPSSAPAVLDLAEVKGQKLAKRALEIAAAGGHNLLLVGPPGSGKSMLARRLSSILPRLSRAEALEVTRVRSVGRRGEGGLCAARPFRAPHHSASTVSLIGGGPSGRPGEVSLAHGGVLFLDELPEFGRAALESLRQPLEDGRAVVARARDVVEYPARFQLIAAANPCPCGYLGHPQKECSCTPHGIERYLGKLSGPLLDRVDMQIEMGPVSFNEWASLPASSATPSESSAIVRERVVAAHAVQRERWGEGAAAVNAFVGPTILRGKGKISPQAFSTLEAAQRVTTFSARAMDRVLRVARTIADLAGDEKVGSPHVAEAVQYRSLDKLRAYLQRRP